MKKRIKPKAGQESVWDYPRPPRLEKTDSRIEIIFNGRKIADTRNAYRVLETSHPPVYYIPPSDIRMEYIRKCHGNSLCEWKGLASYYGLDVDGKRVDKVAWYYPDPVAEFQEIKDHVAFYPALMDVCYFDGEKVQPQPGGFYGGWITKNIVGPFKGETGTMFW